MNGAIDFAGAAAWLPLLAGLAAKATLVLLLAAAVTAAMWRASAAARHLVWCVAVVGVLALPVLSSALPAWEVPLLPAASAASSARPIDVPPSTVEPTVPAAPAAAPTVQGGAPSPRVELLPRLVAWTAAAGVLAGLLWLAAGFWGVSRLGRRAELVRDPEWLRIAHDAAERLGLRRPVLLLRTGGPLMPATWGLLWPSVVLPAAADQWPAERRHAVLAHELAHVKRFDCLTQALAQLACVLFWWHPAVWYAARRLRVERERACDDLVLGSGARASDYAAHLLEVARGHRSLRVAAPAMVSMARPSHLESRLLWVLDAARPRTVPSFGATLLTVLAALLVVGPLSAMRPTAAAQEHLAGIEASASAGHSGEQKPSADKKLVPLQAFAGSTAQADTPVGPRRGGWNDLTPDELIGLRAVGVTPAWLDEMRRSGYADLSVEEATGMRAVGVDAGYVQELAAEGHRGLPAERIAGLRAVGVTAAYLREVRTLGYSGLSLEDIEGMRAVGVDSRYVQEMRGAGLDRLDAETVTELRAVGVTAAYIAEMRAAGLQRLDAETVAELRAVGVTGEYIAGLRAAGLQGLDEKTLAELGAVGVTGAYVRELHAAGLTGLTNRQLAELRAHGVDAAYIRQMDAAGFRALSADELIRLRSSGVERELAESYRRSGGSRP
jgi:beta-lactamase regulating signal transducer with metallopeptidase domain